MKLRNSLFAAILVAITLIANPLSAQKTFATAVELNDYFVSINDSLYKKGNQLGRTLGQARDNKDFSMVKPARNVVLGFTTATLAKLRAMKDQFGSGEFRQMMINFMLLEIDIMNKGLVKVEKLNKKSTDAEITEAIQYFLSYAKDEDAFVRKIGEKQALFAEANGFGIQKREN